MWDAYHFGIPECFHLKLTIAEERKVFAFHRRDKGGPAEGGGGRGGGHGHHEGRGGGDHDHHGER